MKYHIVDSAELVKEKNEKFNSLLGDMFNSSAITAHLAWMLQLEYYIKHTKKTVRLNALKKELKYNQKQVDIILYQSNKHDIFGVAVARVEEVTIERFKRSLINFASIEDVLEGEF